jgi:hypothetical protein
MGRVFALEVLEVTVAATADGKLVKPGGGRVRDDLIMTQLYLALKNGGLEDQRAPLHQVSGSRANDQIAVAVEPEPPGAVDAQPHRREVRPRRRPLPALGNCKTSGLPDELVELLRQVPRSMQQVHVRRLKWRRRRSGLRPRSLASCRKPRRVVTDHPNFPYPITKGSPLSAGYPWPRAGGPCILA